MTQEEKKLLYKDLSARQPYRPFICFAEKFTMPFLNVIASTESNEFMSINGLNLEDVKPYLRSMLSMTDEEKEEHEMFFHSYSTSLDERKSVERIDWLLKHHFDYRGLIEKGLALEAPDDMYKTE